MQQFNCSANRLPATPSAGHYRAFQTVMAVTCGLLAGCSGAPSRNILGSYFPSWMVCALAGIAVGVGARAAFKSMGLLEEIPFLFPVILAIVVAATLAV